ncbi:MAG: ABC transporter substrate-binding protein [Pontibacterium sp.]
MYSKRNFAKRIWAQLGVLILGLLPLCVSAETVLVVLSENSASYEQVLKGIRATSTASLHTISAEELEKSPQLTKHSYSLIVAIGTRATNISLKHRQENTPVIATFIPHRAYNQLAQRHNIAPDSGKTSAVFLDQPYTRQFNLFRIATPTAKTVGVALSNVSKDELPALTQAANSVGLKLSHVFLDQGESPIDQLKKLFSHIDIFLALPDKTLFNRATAKWILYSSLRKRAPILSFSKKYVDSGALLGVYSTPEQAGQHTGEIIEARRDNYLPLPPPHYTRYFNVATNPIAAKNMGIKLQPQSELQKKLEELER